MPSPSPDFRADDAPDDLRAALMSSYDDAESALSTNSPDESPAPDQIDDQATPGAVATDPLPEEAAAPTLKADHPSDPKRYADGSFKPTKAAATGAAPTNEPSKDTQTQASAVAATQPDAPPAGWTAEGKTAWTELAKALPTLPPAAQAAVRTMQMAAIKREEVASAGSRQWSADRQRYEAMIAPVVESARSKGIDPAQGMQMLVAAQSALDRDPASAIRHIARSYGVDLATLAGTQVANGSPEQIQQPDIAALVRQHVDPLLAPIRERERAQAQHEEQRKVDAVNTFASSPGHEHFNSVGDEIIAMLPHVQRQNPSLDYSGALQEAYDRAVYANPTARAAVLAAQEAEKERVRVEAVKTRANGARRAAVSVTGAPSGAPATEAKDSLRAELEAAWSGA